MLPRNLLNGTAAAATSLATLIALSSPSQASEPVPVTMQGCVLGGAFHAVTTDFGSHVTDGPPGGYRIEIIDEACSHTSSWDQCAVRLDGFEGQALEIRGQLLPGDVLIAQPSQFRVTGTCRASSAVPSESYYTPQRGTAERKAILDAARAPVSRDLGQPVIFVVDVLRTDGRLAYLQATPHQPGGAPLDWMQTPFGEDWANDAMSDVIMVVLSRTGSGWRVIDYVIGPTDVFWIEWVTRHNIPEALFHEGDPFVK